MSWRMRTQRHRASALSFYLWAGVWLAFCAAVLAAVARVVVG